MARSCRPNSCWSCRRSPGDGSWRPIQTKTPGCLRTSLMSGMATSPTRLPSAYATEATTPSIGALERAAIAHEDKGRPQGRVRHGGIAQELELRRAQGRRTPERLVSAVGLEEARRQKGGGLGGPGPMRDQEAPPAPIEESPRPPLEA